MQLEGAACRNKHDWVEVFFWEVQREDAVCMDKHGVDRGSWCLLAEVEYWLVATHFKFAG